MNNIAVTIETLSQSVTYQTDYDGLYFLQELLKDKIIAIFVITEITEKIVISVEEVEENEGKIKYVEFHIN